MFLNGIIYYGLKCNPFLVINKQTIYKRINLIIVKNHKYKNFYESFFKNSLSFSTSS